MKIQLTEGDTNYGTPNFKISSFQLMPSRKATSLRLSGTSSLIYFNSRPHGGRHPTSGYRFFQSISPHALREGDFGHLYIVFSKLLKLTPSGRATGLGRQETAVIKSFQLTPSRRATPFRSPPLLLRHFNSRPHGGRRAVFAADIEMAVFQLTPSRRATMFTFALTELMLFQLTPSRRAT